MCRGGCARPRVHGPKGGPGNQRSRAPDAGVLMVLPAEEYSSAHPFLSAHGFSDKEETCQILRSFLLTLTTQKLLLVLCVAVQSGFPCDCDCYELYVEALHPKYSQTHCENYTGL